jgi:hypothetical protein
MFFSRFFLPGTVPGTDFLTVSIKPSEVCSGKKAVVWTAKEKDKGPTDFGRVEDTQVSSV